VARVVATLQAVADEVLDARRSVPAGRSALVAVSGIDAGGKGYFTGRLVPALQEQGVRAIAINADAWLNIDRFDPFDPPEHYYYHSIRFGEMFDGTVFPLRDRRSLQVEMDYAEETSTDYERRNYEYEDVDVIILEGIYLLKRAFQAYYDLSIWIDCGFETALERALARGQEGLPPDETTRDYRDIYNPAQELHFRKDNPQAIATLLINNDARLGEVTWEG
jgi:uridine kinase